MSLKYQLKLVRRQIRRFKAKRNFGGLQDAPILFANSFPKSGTHLLTQVLQGFTQIGPVVDSGLPAMITYEGASGQPRSQEAILRDLNRLQPGDIAYGHLHVLPQVVTRLTQDGVAPYFILRDPRDVVVSHVHYVTDMEPNHVHHQHYRYELGSFDERLRVSILGRSDLAVPFPDISKRFDPYLGWLERSEVLILQFEEFITDQDRALLKVLDHARGRGFVIHVGEREALQALKSAINPAKSPTFRSGKMGKWRASFDEDNKSLFKEIAGDLLIRLGYEDDYDW